MEIKIDKVENIAGSRFPFARLPQLLFATSIHLRQTQLFLGVCGDYLNVSNACGKLG